MADIQSLFYEQIGEKCGKNIADRVSFARDTRNVITLTGQVPVWQQVVDIGHIAGKLQLARAVYKGEFPLTDTIGDLVYSCILSRQGERWQNFREDPEDCTD